MENCFCLDLQVDLNNSLQFVYGILNIFMWESQKCGLCYAVEAIRCVMCKSSCISDSEKEQELMVEQILKKCKKPFVLMLIEIFERKHGNPAMRIQRIQEKIELEAGKHWEDREKFKKKIRELEFRTNLIGENLSTRAAEISEFKSQIQVLTSQTQILSLSDDIDTYKAQTKSLKKTFDEKTWMNSQLSLDIIKFKKKSKKPFLPPTNFKKDYKSFYKILLNIRKRQSQIRNNLTQAKTALKSLRSNSKALIADCQLQPVLSPFELIQISADVFSTYKALKPLSESTHSTLADFLKKVLKIPFLCQLALDLQYDLFHNKKSLKM